jgi:signal transduction histidine kinase
MELVIDVEPTAAARRIRTDVAAVEQVVANLVDNACKYARDAEDSRIHLNVSDVDGAVLLRVRDHGPGIPSEEVGRLFQPFTKSARDAAHSAPGVGLGLALCRRIASQLGGKFYLETPTAEGGASFVLRLPVQPA